MNATSAARRREAWLTRLRSSMPVAAPITWLTGLARARRPRPASAGQLERRSTLKTRERGLVAASVCSRRNRSAYATSGRQNTTLTARIIKIMVTMPQTTWPSLPCATAMPT